MALYWVTGWLHFESQLTYGQDPLKQTLVIQLNFWCMYEIAIQTTSEIQLNQVNQSGPNKMMEQPGVFTFNNKII